MQKKSFFFYGIFFTGSLIAVLWFVGGEALHLKGLAFIGGNTAQAGSASINDSGAQGPNKTALVVQGVLSAYREVAGNDETVDATKLEEVLKEKLSTALQNNIDPVAVPSVTSANLKIVSNTANNESAYGRNTGNIIRNSYYYGLSQELDVFNNTNASTASAEKKELGRKALIKARDAYKKIAGGLLTISVPKQETEKTVTLINAYYLLSAGSDLLARSYADPILSLQGIQTYAKGYLLLKSSF